MTEEITYGLEWCALPEKMHGQSMSKNVRTAEARHMHSGAHCPKIERIKDCGRLDRTPRCTDTQEKSPLAGLPARWRKYSTKAVATSSVSGTTSGVPTLGLGTRITRARHWMSSISRLETSL